MKAAFRQQVSDYDCVPTSIINGLCYLFHRQKIPPYVVKRIYKDCLDVKAFKGTSGDAIHEVAYWLSSFHDKKFAKFSVAATVIQASEVHLRNNGKIVQCLAEGGVALLNVKSARNEWHSILAFDVDDDWLCCYDPAPRTKRYINHDAVQFNHAAQYQEANLHIRRNWLDRTLAMTTNSEDSKYIIGDFEDRECLLMNKA